jgi:acetylornithine deacetylase/succinyl-diaminopimelate desuccinylase-like protein
LVSIPSFVDEANDESELGEFIYQYLTNETKLIVTKQFVTTKRFNVIAYTPECLVGEKLNVDLLLIDHIDTVQPKSGWSFDQLEGREVSGKFFALGAADTKGNVAALLRSALTVKDQRVMYLFYVDEEYDFVGMQQFIAEYKSKLTVKEIISADGNNLAIRSGCRGLAELKLAVIGKTGHAANPSNGVNAITGFMQMFTELDSWLKQYIEPELGRPTLNLAAIYGGLRQANNSELGSQGNNIADYVEAVVECRVNNLVNAEKIIAELEEMADKLKLRLDIKEIRHNLTAWRSSRDQVQKLTQVLGDLSLPVSFTDPSVSGYVDLALATNAFSATGFCIGAIGGNSHGVNEWVDIQSLYQLERIFIKLINGVSQ